MASAAVNQSIAAADYVTIFRGRDDGGPCTTFSVKCRTGSAAGVLIRIQGLHEAGEQYIVNAGEQEYFRINNNGLGHVLARGNGGIATVDYGVVARSEANG